MESPSPLPPLPADERVLLLLGLLTSADRHGYEINDFIDRQLHCVTNIKKATAYLLLDRLEQHGLISSRIEAQAGLKPSRKVYSLTTAGRAHFMTLLAAQLALEEPHIPPGNVAIMFSDLLPPQEQLRGLQERATKLETRLKTYEFLLTHPDFSSGVRQAVERVTELTKADLAWHRSALTRLEGGASRP